MAKYTICKEDDLSVGELRPFKAGKTKIILYRLEDGFYATQHNCTHIFAPLTRGKIVEGCQVQCPFHRARFDIRTGEVMEWANFPPGVQLLNAVRSEKSLQTFPVSIEGTSVLVEIND